MDAVIRIVKLNLCEFSSMQRGDERQVSIASKQMPLLIHN